MQGSAHRPAPLPVATRGQQVTGRCVPKSVVEKAFYLRCTRGRCFLKLWRAERLLARVQFVVQNTTSSAGGIVTSAHAFAVQGTGDTLTQRLKLTLHSQAGVETGRKY